MRVIHFIAEKKDEGRKLLYVLRGDMKLGNRLISALKYQNRILLNGKPVHVDTRVHEGDEVQALLMDEQPSSLCPRHEPVSILWEDEDFFVADKPAPLACQQGRHEGPSLEARLLAHYGSSFVFRPLNRLDKGTSGLLVAAKNQRALPLLQKALHTDEFVREYLAVTVGDPGPGGVIDVPIAREEHSVRRYVCSIGRPCLTEYRTLEKHGRYALVRLRLHTGRTHQIRVHLSHLGCPLAGDFLYGSESPDLPGRFALHSAYVRFVHPQTLRIVEVSSPLPHEIARLLE